jgi:hypothetical protein
VVRLDSEPRVYSVAKGYGSDLKTGSEHSGQERSKRRPPSQLGSPCSLRGRTDLIQNPGLTTQRVATIKNTNASPERPVLTVADKDGDRKITIGPDTAIWIALSIWDMNAKRSLVAATTPWHSEPPLGQAIALLRKNPT